MNYIFLYLCLLFSYSVCSQNVSGEILYKKILKASADQGSDPEAQRWMNEISAATEGLTYVLKFNSEESLFHVEKTANREASKFDARALRIGGGKGRYYKKLNSGKTLRQIEFFGQDFVVEIPDSKYQWKITGDTKKIGKYTVRKAVTSYILEAPHEELEDRNVYLEAWFTSEIPISFGPREICSLPGLVLELTSGRVTYRAYRISLNPEAEAAPEIDPPSQGKLVTEEQLTEIGKNMMDRMRN